MLNQANSNKVWVSELNRSASRPFSIAGPIRFYDTTLRDGEQTVRAITDRSGVSQPAVSKHLGVLKRAQLVQDRRDGRQTHYSARPQGLAPLIDWLSVYGAFWRDRFDRLESLLKETP